MAKILRRSTHQKKLILEVFYSLDHPSIKEVYAEVSKRDKKIGKATVYRVINQLLDEKTIVPIVEKGNCCFDYNTSFHPHIICKKCGKIFDVELNESIDLLQKIKSKYCDFEIITPEIKIIGLCPKCKNIN